MERLLLYAAAIYILYFLWRYLSLFFGFWSLPFERVTFNLQDSLPEALAPLFEVPQVELAALGFADPCPVLVTNITGQQNWGILLHHEMMGAFALVELSMAIDAVRPFGITFYSFSAAHDLVMTANGEAHLVLGTIPRTSLQDAYTPDLSEQWQLHQNGVASQPNGSVKMQPAPFLEKLEAHFDDYFQYLIESNRLGKAGEGSRRYPTVAGILQVMRQYGRGSKRLNKLRQQSLANSRRGDAPLVDLPVALEAHSFRVIRDLQRRKLNRQWKVWLVFITLGLFLVSFSRLMEPRSLLILLGVLLLHEGGHWLAMRLTGYKDMSAFFIPFLGAAVTGRKQQETVWERFLVLLAGPLPGLILGLVMRWVLLTTAVSPWLHELSLMLIIINLLNLLPLYPLDGGQIVSLLLFARRPYADVAFKAVAVIAFGAAAIGLGDGILGFLAVVVALTIRGSFRLGRVFKHVDRSEIPAADEDGRIRASFQAIKEAGYTQLSFGHKFQLVRGLLNRSWHGVMGRRQRLLLAVTYLAVLSGGLALSGFVLWVWGG